MDVNKHESEPHSASTVGESNHVNPTRLDDLRVIDLIEASQIDITSSDRKWKNRNENYLLSNPPVINHSLPANNLLNAMADRTQPNV